MTKLKLNNHKVRVVKYSDAIVTKFDNKRVEIVEDKRGGYQLRFKILDDDPSPRSFCKHIGGKIAYTGLWISTEAAEAVMMSLVEMMGLDLVNEEVVLVKED